eukprot:TRINITY_DN11920_c0_g1_i1.p1 TRINITY_DN11920_c0_g1~~TRINITY_DN11920_c0_g1_i1.p1  ORF type:complete len:393 (+),score=66.56 TRINITY_DN11920_c0_g1_i1:86-1180(+)
MVDKRHIDVVELNPSMIPAKRARIDPLLEEVIKAMEAAAERRGAHDGERLVMVEMVRGGLATPEDKRHPIQALAVEHVGAAVQRLSASLKRSVDEAEAKIIECHESIKALESEKCSEEQQLVARVVETRAAKCALAEKARLVIPARRRHEAACSRYFESNEAHEALMVEKAMYEGFLYEQFMPLRDAKDCEESSISERLQNVEEFSQKLCLEESLVAIFPKALRKPPDSRGHFDVLTLQTFEDIVAQRINEVLSKLAMSATEVEARETAMNAAKEKVIQAKRDLVKAARVYSTCISVDEKGRAAICAIEKRSAEEREAAQSAAESRDACRVESDRVDSGPIISFSLLRQRRSEEDPGCLMRARG